MANLVETTMDAYVQVAQTIATTYNRPGLKTAAEGFAALYRTLPEEAKNAFANVVRDGKNKTKDIATVITDTAGVYEKLVDDTTIKFGALTHEYNEALKELKGLKEAAETAKQAVEAELALYKALHLTPDQIIALQTTAGNCTTNHRNYDALKQAGQDLTDLNGRLTQLEADIRSHTPAFPKLAAIADLKKLFE